MAPEESRLNQFSAAPHRLSPRGGGYSSFVRIAKLALPVVAIIIVGIVIARLQEDDMRAQLSQIAPDEKTTPGQIELVQARYEGRDEKGQPFTVIADKATRPSNTDNVIRLEKPKADIALDSGDWLALHADEGHYRDSAQMLKLRGNVKVFHDKGYELDMPTADINLATRHVMSDHPVKGRGPMGAVTGQNLEVRDGGALVIFGGPATLTINRLRGRG